MKICKIGFERMEINDCMGKVQACCLIPTGYKLGNLLESSLKEIWHGEQSQTLRERLRDGGAASLCGANCPYINDCVEVNEIPEWPIELSLSFESLCNYRCRGCVSHNSMETAKQMPRERYAKNLDIIEARVRECLPHVKKLIASGSCEVFASPRTLRLLGEWRPIADPSEVSVFLITNGSLFNERNWSKIEDLGRYHLKVHVTVMSFRERTYQYLSGTKRPISDILANLRFISSLRRKGVIDDLGIGIVVSEMNFLELPDFIPRCLDEFGADSVVLEPFTSFRTGDPVLEWFYDPRNPLHPYHELYKDVLANPIFDRPDVMFGGARNYSNEKALPGLGEASLMSSVSLISNCPDVAGKIAEYMKQHKLEQLAIYGIGTIGKLLVKLIDGKIKIDALYDKYNTSSYMGHTVCPPPDIFTMSCRNVLLIVTPSNMYSAIKKDLHARGFNGKIASIHEVFI